MKSSFSGFFQLSFLIHEAFLGLCFVQILDSGEMVVLNLWNIAKTNLVPLLKAGFQDFELVLQADPNPWSLGRLLPHYFRLDFEWLVMQPLFSNLNGDHPSFGGSVSKEAEHDLKSTEADPLTLLLGICQATIGIKTLSSLLQVAMEWKLDQVKWVCGSGRLIKVNSEISTWKLANWLVAAAALFLSSKQRTSLKSLTTQHGLSTKLPRSLSSIQNSSFSLYLEGP